MTLGQKIALARKEKGWKQVDLANKIGVSHSTVSYWEGDKKTPTSSNLVYIASLLEKSVEYFLGDDDELKQENTGQIGQENSETEEKNYEQTEKNLNKTDEDYSINKNENNEMEEVELFQDSNNKDFINKDIRDEPYFGKQFVYRDFIYPVEVPEYAIEVSAGTLADYTDPITTPTDVKLIDAWFLDDAGKRMSPRDIMRNYYILRVKGDSMVPMIFDGDILFVKRFENINELKHRYTYIFSIDDSLLVKGVVW